jgi:hypothetical protein
MSTGQRSKKVENVSSKGKKTSESKETKTSACNRGKTMEKLLLAGYYILRGVIRLHARRKK